MTKPETAFRTYQLEDRYSSTSGRVFLTGTQALARIMMDQARRDRDAGLNTAGFVSGYRGSPLGGLDLELWRARKRLEADRITFMPAVNEDLGATAVLGAQQASRHGRGDDRAAPFRPQPGGGADMILVTMGDDQCPRHDSQRLRGGQVGHLQR